MLSHLLKFDYYQVLIKNPYQQISYAARKERPEHKVVINQIAKIHLSVPLDVSTFIQTLKHLVMLEEDSEHWYVITEQINGQPLLTYSESQNASLKQLPEQLIQTRALSQFKYHGESLIGLVAHYAVAGNYWLNKLLTPENIRMTDTGLTCAELILFDVEDIIGFDDKLLQHLNEILTRLVPISCQKILAPVFEASKQHSTLQQWLLYWQDAIAQIEIADETVLPVILDGLYVKEASEAVSPILQRRQNDLSKKIIAEQERPISAPKPVKWPLFVVMAILIAVALYMALPSLKPALESNSTPANPTHSNTKPNSNTLPTTPNAQTLTDDHIRLEGNNWVIDSKASHTGSDAIRLDKLSSMPSNQLTIDQLKLKGTANLSLWLMTAPAGRVSISIDVYSGDTLLDSSLFSVQTIAEKDWSLVTPLIGFDLKGKTATKLVLSFKGDVNQLWIDDLNVESYK